MKNKKVIITSHKELTPIEGGNGEQFSYQKFPVVKAKDGIKSNISFYEIPPTKTAYPLHYHLQNEETFYILSGEGLLRTHDKEITVYPGQIIFFPAGVEGTHQLINTSTTEKLIYLDFDVANDPDIILYPDTDKVAIYSKDYYNIFFEDDAVTYYDEKKPTK